MFSFPMPLSVGFHPCVFQVCAVGTTTLLLADSVKVTLLGLLEVDDVPDGVEVLRAVSVSC